MNTAAKKAANLAAGYRARARARRIEDRNQALRATIAGRTLDTTPAADERRERMAATSVYFEGL